MIEPGSRVDATELKRFGILFGVIIATVFGLIIPYFIDDSSPNWPFVVGATFIVSALVYPKVLIVAYVPWMKFGMVAGWINTRIILGIIFYLLVTPFGLVMRLFGKKLIFKSFEKDKLTYRKEVPASRKDHVEKPY